MRRDLIRALIGGVVAVVLMQFVVSAQQYYTLQPMMRMDGSIFVDAQPQLPQPPVPQTRSVETGVPPIIQPAPQPANPKRIILGLMLPDTTLVCREEARAMTCQTIEELFAKKGK